MDSIEVDLIDEAYQRMLKADINLTHMAYRAVTDEERIRLDAKASGVRLATSYLEDAIRLARER